MDNKQTNRSAEERLAFEEEQAQLDAVEEKLGDYIATRKKRIEDKLADISDWHPVDIEGRTNKASDMHDIERMREKIARYEAYADSPYFGHVDVLGDDGEALTYLIGDEGVSLGAEMLVIDWRRPIANAFYSRSEREIPVDNKTFKLMLRRTVDIKNATLRQVETTYDASSAIDADVVDSFLISVIKDKRRDYKVTSIIRTIQEKQNSILRLPARKSFIVQGCAGSGKTMILLHRLSYLAFNEKGEDFTKYVILTPNKLLNESIAELCQTLELDRIKRRTVDEYYKELIGRSTIADTKTITQGTRVFEVPKVRVGSQESDAEEQLNHELLAELYSTAFLKKMRQAFDDARGEALAKMARAGLLDIFESRGIAVPDEVDAIYPIYRMVSRGERRLAQLHNEAQAELANAKAAHDTAQDALQKEEERFEQAASILRAPAAEAANALFAGEQRLVQDIAKASSDAKDASKMLTEAYELRGTLLLKVNEAEAFASSVSSEATRLENISALISATSPFGLYAKEQCAGLIKEIQTLTEEKRSTGLFGFGQRRRIQTQIDALSQELAARVQSLAKENHTEADEKLEHLRRDLMAADADVRKYDERVQAIAKRIENLKEKQAAYKRCAAAFAAKAFPDLGTELSARDRATAAEAIESYASAFFKLDSLQLDSIKDGPRRRALLEERVRQARQHLRQTEQNILSEDELAAMQLCPELITLLDADHFVLMAENLVKDAYSRHGEAYSSNTEYRHTVYLKLALCALYYGQLDNPDRCLCIDEAQDISLAEYQVLSALIGKDATYNLYGDIDQMICSWRGLESWSSVEKLTGASISNLNENYRNTMQITKHCNKVFGFDTSAIGLTGAKVKNCSMEEAVESINNFKESNPEARVAVICSANNPNANQGELSLAAGISSLSVEQAKGLEFESVVVLEDGMSRNERYIAFTRALDNLFIVRSEAGS